MKWLPNGRRYLLMGKLGKCLRAEKPEAGKLLARSVAKVCIIPVIVWGALLVCLFIISV